jgi:uncharacterized damage-inducible protein DinB
VVAALAVLAVSTPVFAQTASLKAELLKDWQELKTTMRALAEAMPEDRYAYRSTPAQRDFGQQVLHIATANLNNLRFLAGKAAPPSIDRQATGKSEVIRQMDASFDYGTALINEFDDASLMQVVQTNAFLGPSSRARVVWFLLGHTWDIYGQMVVYLRLNGGVPPASIRP